jgi:hypothetical protein
MLKPEDLSQIKERGISPETIEQQLHSFKTGFPFLRITQPAGIGCGLILLNDDEIRDNIVVFDEAISHGLKPTKFVPASGAASRMFKSLFGALDNLEKGKLAEELLTDREVALFKNNLARFAFYDDLKTKCTAENIDIENAPIGKILELLLTEKGLNYGNLPKGLLKFHAYPTKTKTSMEEHFVEGALYSKDSKGTVNLHFTVSPEHLSAFAEHVESIKPKYEQLFEVSYQVSFSIQKPSTDTLAVTADNEPFRNPDGSLLFRPAGHGALLENLNVLDADLVFIKNIDNVVPDHLKEPTVNYKKALAGLLLKLQKQIFHYQQLLNEHHPATLESAFYAEAANFLENILNITPPNNQYYSEKEELYHYFREKFFRPIRVCGMVKNQGEPGGGPFFAQNSDGSVSLQIAESSQIDFQNAEQAALARSATHFNPVDLVCAFKNYSGEKYNLPDFRDAETGFISVKSQNGKELKAQELPGLWNGAMSDWNTIFVEVPLETFNPVKTVTDLLRKEHQPK